MKHTWLKEFTDFLFAEEMLTDSQNLGSQGSFPLLLAKANYWDKIAQIAKARKYRFAGIWAKDLISEIQMFLCFEFCGEYFLVSTLIDGNDPKIASITPYYAAANRLERHVHDMFGVIFLNHPDPRKWTRHQAWSLQQFPLRKKFSIANLSSKDRTESDSDYPFLKIKGAGVCEIPVGPVHAGIIEPGHFRFNAAGEDIISLEERLGYVHKGVEKIAEGRNIDKLIKLAGRVSGDSTVSYAFATCRAIEDAFGFSAPTRANFIRGIMAERERIANHLGDFAAICNDVGYSFPYYQIMRLKEKWLRMNKQIFNHRLMMDAINVYGVAYDLNEKGIAIMQSEAQEFKKELNDLYVIFEENSSLHDRLKNTGKLSPELAFEFGALGFVGRASGLKFDLRILNPYPPYNHLKICQAQTDFQDLALAPMICRGTLRVPNMPTYIAGDVLARTRIRAQEVLVSLDLLSDLLEKIPAGPIQANWQIPRKSAQGLGLVEGWRGEILIYLSFDDKGLVDRFFPRDPSWFNWPLLERLVYGNIVPDFPVCNKSINGSYSGVDL